ncbi:MAG: hypothetical protein ACJ76Z_15245 [Thermoleophilaceae bacterium]
MSRGVVDTEELPACCPACGAVKPWVGPIALPGRFDRTATSELPHSPFYLAALSPARDHRAAS